MSEEVKKPKDPIFSSIRNHLSSPEANISNWFNTKFTDKGTNWVNAAPRFFGDVSSMGIVPGVALGAVGLGLLGRGASSAYNLFSSGSEEEKRKRKNKFSLLGMLAGAGLGGLAGYSFTNPNDPIQKRLLKFSFATGSSQSVEQSIYSDPSINGNQKQALMNAVKSLQLTEYMDLHRLIRTAGGAATGALIAKFLMNRGIGGIIIASIAGGLIGSLLSKPNKTQTEDYFGRPRLL